MVGPDVEVVATRSSCDEVDIDAVSDSSAGVGASTVTHSVDLMVEFRRGGDDFARAAGV
jgi:hypothetical protein